MARPRALAAHPALDYNASFSPDGRWIVFTSHRAGSADLYRIRPDGSELERLTDDPAFDDQGAFSPDGQRLAFVSTRSGQADIWTLDLETRRAHVGDQPSRWRLPARMVARRPMARVLSDREPARTSCPNTTQPGPGPFVTPQFTSIFVARTTGAICAASRPPPSRLAGHGGPPTDLICSPYTAACRSGVRRRADVRSWTEPDRLNRLASRAIASRHRGTGSEGISEFAGRWVASPMSRALVSHSMTVEPRPTASSADPTGAADGSTMVFHRETDRSRDQDRAFKAWHSPDTRFNLLRLNGHTSFSPTAIAWCSASPITPAMCATACSSSPTRTARTGGRFMKDR